MAAEWVIVLNADGTVLTVDGSAPADWVGTRVETRDDVPDAIKRAVAEARRQVSQSPTASVRVDVREDGAASLLVLALHAMPLHLVPTDLRALLQSSLRIMERQARVTEVALTLEVDDSVPRICQLDPEKIAWATAALVGNALRYVRHGTRLLPGGAIQVRARFESGADRIVLEIRDDGVGIPAEKLPQLLRRQPGEPHAAGLALSLVQDVMAAHGGTVQIESSTEPDRSGSTVRLMFPAG